MDGGVFFFEWYGDHRKLHRVDRRQRQMCIRDSYNRNAPQLPKIWDNMKASPKWLIWEYESGKFRFNGTYKQFVDLFGVDPAQQTAETTPAPPAETTNTGGYIHLQCPHCGKKIF